jgi:hypothetical protein
MLMSPRNRASALPVLHLLLLLLLLLLQLLLGLVERAALAWRQKMTASSAS